MKKKMTNEDFKYLNKHLETLAQLKQSGYKCDKEISTVISKLHKLMGLASKSKVNFYTLGSNVENENIPGYKIGVDFPKGNRLLIVDPRTDYTTVLLVNVNESKFENIKRRIAPQTFGYQADLLVQILKEKRPDKLLIDTCGIGKGLMDMVIEKLKTQDIEMSPSGDLTYS